MEDGDLALFPGAGLQVRNHDVHYPFRQQSDFWYLTGHQEAGSLLMLAKGVDGCAEETLFVLPKDPERETWEGIRLGPEGAKSSLGFADAHPLSAISERVGKALEGASRLWYRLGEHPETDSLVSEALADLRRRVRTGVRPPAAILDPVTVLHEQRLFKDPTELDCLRRAGTITEEGHRTVMGLARPGGTEFELEAALHWVFRSNGCDGAGWSYPSIVASGNHACVLHYTSNDGPLTDGDMVLVDAGAEFKGYAGDVTRCFPVNGSFSAPQRAVYEVVLAAQEAAIAKVVAGNPFDEIHQAALSKICEGLVQLGVVQGTASSVEESGEYKPWFMHNTSHWLGLDVHDAGSYHVDGDSRPLEPGMCLTVEPGLYFREDDSTVPEEFRGLGIRIEDDVVVTAEGGPEILSVGVPKSIEAVEEACAAQGVSLPGGVEG